MVNILLNSFVPFVVKFITFAQKYNILLIPVNKDFNSNPILIDDYDYALPDERIAKYPLKKRDQSKLLVYRDGEISEDIFLNSVSHLPEHALLVYNNTKVIHARLLFQKSTGAQIEVFCLEPLAPSDYALSLGSTDGCSWKCMVGNLKKWKQGNLIRNISINGQSCQITASLIESAGNTHQIRFEWDNTLISFAEILDNAGELPIPPYLHRKTEESDKTTYQTIYSKIKGSVAAPTAGLHFTNQVLDSLKQKNIQTGELTLHVGAGTFQPVKAADIADHEMHAEVISVKKETIEKLLLHAGNVIAVGTTSVRTLESLYFIGMQILNDKVAPDKLIRVEQWEPYQQKTDISTEMALRAILNYLNNHQLTVLHAQTQIIIHPGYVFRVIRGMFTNFHQPRSTLLLLVSAFTGENWKKIYDYALSHNFRFLSYGDSSLLLK
ncbi:S-adenosylmethionine:tRNA ribosyltransferase-isomerase [bioreactor metagenome]|uniref:S-adenosylmethionine:tRNA ribosyltransferase-isomerase n=1 Tax=bioreactor metagenome TaxID=1076179 RepID=A0A644V0Y4_9ZZZZ|nr:S-adenosylmethionine:tRNA ribosyltransferase-isomerase [Paludibacter sp.]